MEEKDRRRKRKRIEREIAYERDIEAEIWKDRAIGSGREREK